MAIRLREVNGELVALCAARSIPKDGDRYLDDGEHYALFLKFRREFEDGPVPALVEAEESNNPNRKWWDQTYS